MSTQKKSVLMGMSGGIDSACAAHFLQKDGFDVSAAYMHMIKDAPTAKTAAKDAERISQELDIPFHELHVEDIFYKKVIEYFAAEYRIGRTPNPCVMCNPTVKFRLLLEKADELGIDLIATGHYVRKDFDEKTKTYRLKEAADPRKDQTYFLFMLDQEILSRSVFPLSEHAKSDIREIITERIPFVRKQKESQEICFIPESNYSEYLEEKHGFKPLEGEIKETSGKVLGKHNGYFRYTIGQRRGLGIAAPYPLYVTKIDADKNEVIVGKREETYKTECRLSNLNWISGKAPEKDFEAEVRLRYNQPRKRARIIIEQDMVVIKLTEPDVVTPGQAGVIYDGEYVLGGGWI